MNLVPLFEEAIEFQNYNGSVLSNGKVAVFYIGRTRLADIFNDIEGLSPAENPKVLDNLGMGPLYVNPAFDYEIIVYDAYDNEMFSVKKYLHSKGEHSTANVVVTPSENIAVSAWTIGDVQVYMPYLTGDVGKTYEGIDPIVVNNEYNRISANHIPLGVQDPLYFVEDSESACIIGMSGGTVPEGTMAESGLGFENNKITGYNGSAFSAGNEYKAGSYVDITDNTISVTGLSPLPADTASTGLVASVSADITAMIPDTSDMATQTWVNEQGFLTAHQDISNKLDTTAFSTVSGNYATQEDIESATQNLVPGSVFNKSINDLYTFVNSNFVYYGNKPSNNVIEAYGNQLNGVNKIYGSDLSIWTALFQVNGLITASPYGFTAVGVSAVQGTYDSGFSAHGVTAGVNSDLTIKGKSELLSSMDGKGFILSSVNTGIGSAVLTLANNSNIVSPKFEAKNISGAGFSIEASGAKGYDQNGNVTWDVNKPAKLIGWNNYQGTAVDSRASGVDGSIIATVLPDNVPESYMLTSAPYAYMNGMGFFACYPDGTKLSVDVNSHTISVINTAQKYTASMNPGDISYSKYDAETSATDVWSLTGSLQKSEIEGDSATSAITAIAGSAIGGGGDLTGNFLTAVPDTYLQNTDLNTTDGKISAISGIPLEDTSNVFVAVYNTTTYNEIASAYDAGKAVVCKYDKYLLNLCYKDNERIIFAGFAGRGIYQYATTERVVQCTNTNLWVNHSYGMQADWNEKNSFAPSYINNKPDLTQYQTTAEMTAYLTAVPATYLQNTDLSTTDGKVTAISGIPLSAGSDVPTQQEVSHDNTLSGNGTVDSPLGVNNEYIKLLSVNQPLTAVVNNYVATASVPVGYEFLCWVNMGSNGFSQVFYPEQPTSATCVWWLGGSFVNPGAGDSVDSRYLVVKKA